MGIKIHFTYKKEPIQTIEISEVIPKIETDVGLEIEREVKVRKPRVKKVKVVKDIKNKKSKK